MIDGGEEATGRYKVDFTKTRRKRLPSLEVCGRFCWVGDEEGDEERRGLERGHSKDGCIFLFDTEPIE